MPLIQVKLSEGKPCLYDIEYNNVADKSYYILYNSDYYTGCTKSLGDDYYSLNHRALDGFGTATEYEMYSENNNYMSNYIQYFTDYDEETLKKYAS